MIVSPAITTFALYAAVRSLVLAGSVLFTVYTEDLKSLRLLAVVAAIIQILDAGVGICQHDIGKTAGPLIIAALQACALRANARQTP